MQIAIKWDEYLALEILKEEEESKGKLTEKENLGEQRKKAYLWDVVDGRHWNKSRQFGVLRLNRVGIWRIMRVSNIRLGKLGGKP